MPKTDNQSRNLPKGDCGENPLEELLKRIRRNVDFPSISKYLVEINQKLSKNPDTSDASELANVILKDYALTSKLLKLVNSASYGFASGKVSTVTRAVVVLGYEYIRLATVSLTLFEHFKGKANAADLKEAVVSSFWNGVMARGIAESQSNIDPEEAFICAMMGHLGKLVAIYYLPDEYRQITRRMLEKGESETRAARATCGVTYDELGLAIANQWNFPDQICDSLQKVTDKELKNKGRQRSRLCVLSNFVKELSGKIQGGDFLADDRLLQDMLDRYQLMLKLSRHQIRSLVKDSIDQVHKHAKALQFDIDNSDFINKLSAESYPETKDRDETQEKLNITANFQLDNGSGLKTSAHDPVTVAPVDIIMGGIQEISEAMMSNHEINDIALMSLEILYRALKFNRTLMFIRDSQNQMMSVRFGYGQQSEQLANKVRFRVTATGDLFNISIQRGKDLIVADTSHPQTSPLIPDWYRRHINAPAFIFLPVVVQNICIGAFYADRETSGHPISETEHRHLSMLRNQLVLAIKYRQGAK